MKKLMILALASSAMVASPAFAADLDGIGQFAISAPVSTYCVFGQSGNGWGSLQNASGTGNHSQGYAGADGALTFNIQAADDTVQAASATYTIQSVVCNTPFKISSDSANNGLKTSATTNDTDFTSLVDYKVKVSVDGIAGTEVSVNGDPQLFSSAEARAGVGTLKLSVGQSNKLLLKGAYTDTLTFTMTPSV